MHRNGHAPCHLRHSPVSSTNKSKVANNGNAQQQHHRPCSRSLGRLPDCHCKYRFLGKRSTTQAPSTVSSTSPTTKKPASTPTPSSLFPNATYRPPFPVRSSSTIPPLHDPPLPSFPLPHYQHQPTLPPHIRSREVTDLPLSDDCLRGLVSSDTARCEPLASLER